MPSDCFKLFADILRKIGFKDFNVNNLKCLEENSDMQAFIEWLVHNTSEENYITEEEFYLYNDLKREISSLEVSLDSECEVVRDNVICSFGYREQPTEEISNILSIDNLKSNVEFVSKNVQSLRCLEAVIQKEKRRDSKPNISSEALLKKELGDIDVANCKFNEALATFTQAWTCLYNQTSCEKERRRISEETVTLLETYLATDKALEEKLSDELNRISEERTMDETAVVSMSDFEIICHMLVKADSEQVRRRALLEANDAAALCFLQLLNQINQKTDLPSLGAIRKQLMSLWEEREGLLVERLKGLERELQRGDWLAAALLEAERGAAAHLQSCLNWVAWGQEVVESRGANQKALVHLLKRERVLLEEQLHLGNQCSTRMSAFTARLPSTEGRLAREDPRLPGSDPGLPGSDPGLPGSDPRLPGSDPPSQSVVRRCEEPACVGMMGLLGRNTDLRGLNSELALLRTSASSQERLLVSTLRAFTASNLALSEQIKGTSREVFQGPTRDVCTTIFSAYTEMLKDLSNSVSEEETTFKDFLKKFKKGAKKESYWLNCMMDPLYFIENLARNTDRVDELSQKNKQRLT